MLYISDNLKHLRSRAGLSQQEAAAQMKFGLDQYKKYEYGKNTPPAESLLVISRFYHISIDLLLTVNLQKIEVESLVKLEDNRIVLPIKVDVRNNNLIEIVPHKARMGYVSGYADPDYIEGLQTISLPFLNSGKFRAFPASGDSMPPHRESSIIIGKYVEKLSDVKDGRTYIVVTREDGIVYKRLKKNSENSFLAISDNPSYAPYDLKHESVIEIWSFVCSIETEAFQPNQPEEGVRALFETILSEMRAFHKA